MLQRFKPRLVARRFSQGEKPSHLRPPGLFDGVKPARQPVKAFRPKPQDMPSSFLSPPGVEVRPSEEVDAGPTVSSERDAQIARLRAALLALESGQEHEVQTGLSLGDLDQHLPGRGLPVGVLNEVTAAYAHRPAAFGFTFALMALGQKRRPGPVILVMSRRALRDFGHPYGHGLSQLGLDVGDLILVETDKDIDALWGIEEALRARGCVALVAGAIAGNIDLTAARRLNLAAASTGTPLVVLRTGADATGPAATRWRIETAPAERDAYGGFGRGRWHAHLERCRNGRPGHWNIEWCHVAHRFHLVESLADRAPVAHPSRARRAG
jgi:protein ImuA